MAKHNNTVTRSELIDALHRLELHTRRSEGGERLTREECSEIVEAILEKITKALVAGETVKLAAFGAFSVREKAERLGRNPKTREDAVITPRRVPTFRASNVLKEALNAPEGAPSARERRLA